MEVYRWLGIGSGMTVADLRPSAGYNTHLFSRIVGPGGRVLAIGPPSRPTPASRFAERIRVANLENVVITERLEHLESNTLDVVLSVRDLHDLYIVDDDVQYIYKQLLRALRPGGIFGVVDVRTDKPEVDRTVHRINEDFIVQEITAAGFVLAGRSDLLAAEGDDYDVASYAARWELDRMLLKFVKPD